jgi:hypothetical protein
MAALRALRQLFDGDIASNPYQKPSTRRRRSAGPGRDRVASLLFHATAGAACAFQHAHGAADRGHRQADLGGQLSSHRRTHYYLESGDRSTSAATGRSVSRSTEPFVTLPGRRREPRTRPQGYPLEA